MKRITCLFLAAALGLAALSGTAEAVEFKVKGRFVTLFEYGQNSRLTKGNGIIGYGNGSDEFNAQQRLRLQMDAVASESLSGTLYLEIGQIRWGQGSRGGAMGADSSSLVKLKNAYIDWQVPDSGLKLRMGVQKIAAPAHTSGSWVYGADTAGITGSYSFNEHVDLAFFWARPWNDNFTGSGTDGANYMDNMDLFGLSLPLSFDGFKITPWVFGGAFGPNTFRTGENYLARNTSYFEDGLFPLLLQQNGATAQRNLHSYSSLIWAGIGADIFEWDPFRLAFDFYYGAVHQPDDASLNRSGWLGILLMEYKLDWGIPGLIAWYSSGDDANLGNGSERMPYLDRDESGGGSFSNFAFHAGRPSTQRDAVISHSLSGTWGVGLRIRNLEWLIDDLKHTLRVNLIGGTNDPDIVDSIHNKYGIWMTPNNFYNNGSNMLGTENLYMTRNDYALELGIRSDYKVYENLTIGFDLAYVAAWLDKGVWGNSKMNGKDDTVADAWNAGVIFMYSF